MARPSDAETEEDRAVMSSFSRRLRSWLGSVAANPQWGAADAEIKVPSGEIRSLNVPPLKPGVGKKKKAIHAALTARDFFVAYFYPSGPFTSIFPKPLPIFPVLAMANTGPCVGPQNKIGHPTGCRFPG